VTRRYLLAAIALALCVVATSGCGAALSGPSITTTTPGGTSEQIPVELSRPEGSGPFPAVVIMHDCSGLGPLRTLPYVDGARVGLMGGSHGGSTTLTSMIAAESDADLLARERRAGFTAAVALYPGCVASRRTWSSTGAYRPVAPLLILIGEKDDWTPAEPRRRLAEAAQQAGYPVTIKIYPGTYHSFDSYAPVRYVAARVNANAPGGRGATTGGDPAAWADSIREVSAFFGRYLR
jgi:dienelactone hydrolase